MNDEQLLRYSRHILLPQIGFEGQQRLARAHALIVGLGGLGSPAAMYLAASGVGRLTLCDGDRVELSNLQRQILHTTASVGRVKTDSAAQTLHALNPEVSISALARRLDADALGSQVATADVVLDCSDNFATRFALNAACMRLRKPLVSGAVIRLEGQVAVFRGDRADAPCYRCLYQDGAETAETCSQTGVLAPAAGLIGSLQAIETLKLLLDLPHTLSGRLLLVDVATMEFRTVKLNKDPACPVCSRRWSE